MQENRQCSSPGCGCNLESYPTAKKCPSCRGRLRLVGRSQRLEFRLDCRSCGYHSSFLTQEEIEELL